MHWESLVAVIHGPVLNLTLEFTSYRSPVVCTCGVNLLSLTAFLPAFTSFIKLLISYTISALV